MQPRGNFGLAKLSITFSVIPHRYNGAVIKVNKIQDSSFVTEIVIQVQYVVNVPQSWPKKTVKQSDNLNEIKEKRLN